MYGDISVNEKISIYAVSQPYPASQEACYFCFNLQHIISNLLQLMFHPFQVNAI